MKVLLVASGGGHLTHLRWLAPWWSKHERAWVTFDTVDARHALDGERVTWAHHPTNRHPANLVRNGALAVRVVGRERPDVLVTTGAGVAVPFVAAARAVGIPCVFIEVYDRVARASLSGTVCARLGADVVVQWPVQCALYEACTLLGPMR